MEALAVPPGRGGFSLSLHRLLDLHAAVLLQPFLGVGAPMGCERATVRGDFARVVCPRCGHCGVRRIRRIGVVKH